MSDTNYLYADPCSTATQGLLDEDIGIATLGWIIRATSEEPIIKVPIGQLIGEPNRDWWLRKDDTDPWFGPLSYRDANAKARRSTLDVDETINETKYAQVGTILGSREGDPLILEKMVVVFMYVNGKMYIGGKLAEYNKDKVPL